MADQQTALADLVRDRFKSDKPASPESDGYTEQLVASTLADHASSGSRPEEVLEQLLDGVVKGVSATGVSLWLASRGAMLGALRSAGAAGVDHARLLELVPAILVRLTEAGGGDFGAAAKGAVEGAIEGCALAGLDEEEAANRTATSAYRAAAELRESAAIRIRHITTPQVRGIPVAIL